MKDSTDRRPSLDRLPLLCSILLTFLLAAPASASEIRQPKDPDTPDSQRPAATITDRITVTATGEERRIEGLPLPITVITRDEIDNAQDESVADLLRRVPGIAVVTTGDQGSQTSLFVRGTESDQTLALFDGVRLNSPYFAGYDWSLQNSGGIERVEVARGPYSALWGSDAIGGVVNVLPRRGDRELEAQLFGEVGEDNWERLEGSVGVGNETADFYASALDRSGRGELQNSDFANRQLLLDAGYSWSPSGRVAILLQDLDSKIGIPFSNPGSLTPNRRQDAKQQLYALPLRIQASDRWSFNLVPSVVERELVFRDPDDPFGFTASNTLADTVQVRLASHHDLGGDRRRASTVSWGGEWREDEVDDSSSFGTNLDGERIETTGVFVQELWQPSDSFTLIAGVRWDDADEWGSEVSPRLSIGWQATSRVELRAGYGEAFRQPSIGELYFPFSGNPALEAERSQSLELGFGLAFAKHRIDAFAFATDTDNLIDFDFATFVFVNRSFAEIRGFELSWSVPVTKTVYSSLQGTWLDTEDADGLSLLRRPEWGASWTFSGPLTQRLRGDLVLRYVGSRADVDPITFGRAELDHHTTTDLALGYRVLGGLEVTLRVQNLADEEYQEVAGYPAAGRRLSGGLRWSM